MNPTRSFAVIQALAAVVFVAGCSMPAVYQGDLSGRRELACTAPAFANGVMKWAKATPGGQQYEVRTASAMTYGPWPDCSTSWEAGSYVGVPPQYVYRGRYPHTRFAYREHGP